MSSDQMKVFNEYVMPVISQLLPQRIAAFNEAAPGIQLSSAGIEGDFFEQSFYNALHTNQRRVDIYAANASVSPVDLSQGQQNSVKVHGGFGPIRFEPKQFRLLQKPTQEGVTVIAGQFVDAYIQDQLNTGVACLVAAAENQAAATFNESTAGPDGTATLNQQGLNSTHAKGGDMSQMFRTQIMRGAHYHQFIGEALTNANQLFMADTVTVVDILGKRTIVSDIPALTADAGATAKVPVIADGGIMIDATDSDIITNIQTNNGSQRIESTWQTDYDFTVGLKGYSWDETDGGKSPTDAELGTGTNWDLISNDIKFSAGLIYIANA